METEKSKKDQYFITIVILGTLGVVMTNIVSNDINFLVLGSESIGFIVIMYLLFYFFPALIKKVTSKISDIKKDSKAKLEVDVISTNDRNFLLRIKNYGNHTVKDVTITWVMGLQVLENFPNESYKQFENWAREKKTLEWTKTNSDVINIAKGKTKDAYILNVFKDELQLHLHAFKSEPAILPLEDCTLALLANMIIYGKNRKMRIYIDLGKHGERLVVNRVSVQHDN